MFTKKAYPEFSWSHSRHKTLFECAKKYGFHYYFSHNGWLNGSSDQAKEAYRLKKITNLPIHFGEIVHDIIEKVIRNFIKTGLIPEEEQLTKVVRQGLNQAFIDSVRNKELWFQKPSRYKMLHEIYYSGSLQAHDKQRIEERLEACLKHFLASETFTEVTTNKNLTFIEAEQFHTMMINQVKVYVVMDFLYHDLKRDKWIIVDWKTGKESADDQKQLALYALYVKENRRIPLEQIEIRNEYLVSGTSKTYQVTEADIEALRKQIELSVVEMNKYVIDEDTNQPVELSFFKKTEHEKKCQSCNYKQICL
ncbi:RecB family exonuclease [Bacillus alkalicellulosilyticus]|uniref:RecB family exonuclease n=1 Tax=Alkalihalobacterium alkalicellulosilyticum TaxID=1912214 RepID=UPI000998D0C2|nr:PD-(D/E)XK nuclease family protein [Bacillus alkalicellulosilyticus]